MDDRRTAGRPDEPRQPVGISSLPLEQHWANDELLPEMGLPKCESY